MSAKLESIREQHKQGYKFSVGSKLAEEPLYNPYLRLEESYFESLMPGKRGEEKFARLRKVQDEWEEGRESMIIIN